MSSSCLLVLGNSNSCAQLLQANKLLFRLDIRMVPALLMYRLSVLYRQRVESWGLLRSHHLECSLELAAPEHRMININHIPVACILSLCHFVKDFQLCHCCQYSLKHMPYSAITFPLDPVWKAWSISMDNISNIPINEEFLQTSTRLVWNSNIIFPQQFLTNFSASQFTASCWSAQRSFSIRRRRLPEGTPYGLYQAPLNTTAPCTLPWRQNFLISPHLSRLGYRMWNPMKIW